MIEFPSLEWFRAMRGAVNADPDRFKKLGTVDMTLVAKIDFPNRSECYEVVFSGYRCTGVRHIPDETSALKGAVILEGAYGTWREMIENIESTGKADLKHTLNTLTLLDTPMLVRSENQLDTDCFYRYQQNLQEFFDGAAQFRTVFREVGNESPSQRA